jgi:hypothetical protein
MPDQAGTWLGTRRATGHAPQMDGFIGPDLEAIAGKGPGLAGFRIAPIRLCNRRSSPSGTRCGSSGLHADRVTSQTRLAKLREG